MGIAENLDILELVMRSYMYYDQACLESSQIENMTEDIIRILLENMEAMSINLEGTESEEAELYIDFRNIYMVFLLRLNEEQIASFSDKILYKIKTSVPEHRQAYEFIVVGLCYMNKSLPRKILDICYK